MKRVFVFVLAIVLLSGARGAADDPARLMGIGEILALPEQADREGWPVVTRGVLVYYEPGHRMAFLQDGGHAIYLHVTEAVAVAAGDYVEVRGVVDPGWSGRNLQGESPTGGVAIRRVSEGTFPPPAPCASPDALRHAPGARWTSVTIDVRSVTLEGDRARLDAKETSGIPVYIAGITRHALLPSHLEGLRAEVRGVLAEATVSERPLVMQRQFLVPGMRHVIVPGDVFAKQFQRREIPVVDLRWMPEREGGGIKYLIRGGATWIKPGEGFFMQQGDCPAWVHCTMADLPPLYEQVACVGVAAAYQGSGILQEAIWKSAADPTIAVIPEKIGSHRMREDLIHGRYVELEGDVMDHLSGPTEDLTILEVEGETVLCHLDAELAGPRPGKVGRQSLVTARGVLLNRPSPAFNTEGTVGAFHLLMRSPADLTVLANPPFWNMRRVIIMLCCLLAAVLLFATWSVTLRRKVKQQAETIRHNAAKQAVEEERVRIARDWHDSFEQHFAGLTILLDGATSILERESPMWTVLKRATRMADRSRSEARQAIWDLRTSAIHKDEPFRRELEDSLRRMWPEDSSCELVIGSGCDDVVLPRSTALHLLRIANEAVTNALKHSGASVIRVNWMREGDSLRLSITDDGAGLPAGVADSASAKGHFGVLGMRERACRIDGVFEIHSPPLGRAAGTVVSVALPFTNVTASP